MAMALWRYNVLVELFDLQPDTYILADEPRKPHSPPVFVHKGVFGDQIPWARFNQLVESGDIVEYKRGELPVDNKHDEPMTLIYYKLGENGEAALQALPNFDKRVQRQRAVTL